MKITSEVICPYCGFKNKFTAEATWGRELHNCNCDEGGCDGTFVIEYRAHITTTTKRVEGEEKHAAAHDETPSCPPRYCGTCIPGDCIHNRTEGDQ